MRALLCSPSLTAAQLPGKSARARISEAGRRLDFIAFNSRDSYISTRFTETGRELITDAFRAGTLSPGEVIANELIAAA